MASAADLYRQMVVTEDKAANGCIAMWSSTHATAFATVEELGRTVGVSPAPVGHTTAMRRALDSMARRDDIVVQIDAHTFAIARKTLGAGDAATRDVGLDELCRVSVAPGNDGADGALVHRESAGCEAGAIRTAYVDALATYTASDVGVFLSRYVIPSFRGVPMRDRGGVYLIPTDKLDSWTAFADKATLAGLCNAHSIPVAYGERFTRLAVESVTSFVEAELAQIRWAVESGNLGAKALRRRLDTELVDLELLVNDYADLLGSTMGILKGAADEARACIEAALIMQEAESLRAKRKV